MEMTAEKAYGMIRALGAIFGDALTAAGHDKPAATTLIAGIAAYNKLNLQGEDAELDKAYNICMTDMLEAVRGSWKASRNVAQ